MHWEAVGVSDRGRLRPANEDAFLIDLERGLFCVADGLGGHAAGEVASAVGLETFVRALEPVLTGGTRADAVESALVEAVRAANQTVLRQASSDPAKEGMGTTLTGLLLLPDQQAALIAHVGDSRAYRLRRGGGLEQLTTDHTWVQQQIDKGLLREAEAERHPYANVLVRALGTAETVEADVIRLELEPGDLILICSDGLTAAVPTADLQGILAGTTELDPLAGRLVDEANRRGGPDNITVVLIRVTAPPTPSAA